MKKRIIVLSDLHIGKGTILDGERNVREDFLWDDDFYEFLKFWTEESKGYELELVLNGDIFDIIKSIWKHGKVTKSEVFEFFDIVFNGHKKFFSALKDFSYEGGKIIYIIGNHDQAVTSQEIQNIIVDNLDITINFKKEYIVSGILIEHGNKYELVNRVDLKNVWVVDSGEEILNAPWGTKFVIEVVSPFMGKPFLDRVRPVKNLIIWGLLFETKLTIKALIKAIKFIAKNRWYYDPIRLRKYRVPIKSIFSALGHKQTDKAAIEILNRKDIRCVVFGHTHKAIIKNINGKYYVNSGTWTPYVSLELPFIGLISKKTFALIDIEGEKLSPPLLFEWHGIKKPYSQIPLW